MQTPWVWLGQATVDFKFEHWGQRLLYAQLVLYNVWLFAFTIFTIIFQAGAFMHVTYKISCNHPRKLLLYRCCHAKF